MEGLAKYDLEAVLHVELKTDIFVQKIVVIQRIYFYLFFEVIAEVL